MKSSEKVQKLGRYDPRSRLLDSTNQRLDKMITMFEEIGCQVEFWYKACEPVDFPKKCCVDAIKKHCQSLEPAV